MKFESSFGTWLRQRRKALDLTQAELADQIGCAKTTIQKIEGDERRPSKQIAERMADVLAIADIERAAFMAFARRALSSPVAPPVHVQNPVGPDLPPQPTPFVGRKTELAQIAERLANPTCRLLTLVGSGGIGKTRLALQAAADKRKDFAHGVYFVSLASVTAPHLIATAIANALKIGSYGQQEPAAQIMSYLRLKDVLLIL